MILCIVALKVQALTVVHNQVICLPPYINITNSGKQKPSNSVLHEEFIRLVLRYRPICPVKVA